MKLALLTLTLALFSAGASTHKELDLVIEGGLSSSDRTLLSFLGKSSFGRNEVIDLIVNEYTSMTSATDSSDDVSHWLHKAIQAIEFSETDGEPVQVKGHNFLFVGSVGASRNQDFLRQNNITHVINWSTTARCDLFGDIKYLCTAVRGHRGMRNHLDELDEAVEFVESARKSGGRVLSHCWYGKNRSVTLLVAYLMKYEGMGANEANNLIKETRPQAAPYWDSLEEYSNRLNIS